MVASIAAATAAGGARGAARTLTRFVDVVHILRRDGITVPRHDGIRQAVPFVGLDPRLNLPHAPSGGWRRQQQGTRRTRMNYSDQLADPILIIVFIARSIAAMNVLDLPLAIDDDPELVMSTT